MLDSLHKESNSFAHTEVNHVQGSYVYTMGILYMQILRWQTEQLVNSSWHYVSTKPVQRFLSQELLKVIVL